MSINKVVIAAPYRITTGQAMVLAAIQRVSVFIGQYGYGGRQRNTILVTDILSA